MVYDIHTYVPIFSFSFSSVDRRISVDVNLDGSNGTMPVYMPIERGITRTAFNRFYYPGTTFVLVMVMVMVLVWSSEASLGVGL